MATSSERDPHGPAKKFVDLHSRAGPDGSASGHHAVHNDLSVYDETDMTDPYMEELLDVLDRVENEGEPYLEKLIIQAGLDFTSPDEDELSTAGHTKAAGQRVKLKKKKKHEPKKMVSKVEMGIVEPISDDDFSQIYSAAKEGGGTEPSDKSASSRSSTSTESLAEDLAEMVARGKAPVLKEKPSKDIETYGTRIIPYGSFNVNNNDAGLTKHAPSDKLLRAARMAASSSPENDFNDKELEKEGECIESSSSDLLSHATDFEEDLYDEGKNEYTEEKEEEHRGPEMVLLSSSSDEEDLESPPQYFEYTKQEEQCLAIVANFRRQFTDAYPDRKPLLLTPVNEEGVPRFVCTTIRPTIFSYDDLFQWDGIARFFAFQMEYILLNPPELPPTVVMSPASIMKERQGNAFDYCFILASVLIGVGYDAYIVNGYAAAAICTGDESKRICPLLPQDTEPDPIPEFEKEFDLADFQSSVANECFKHTIRRQRERMIKERNECVKGLEYLLKQEKIRAGLPPHDGESQSEEEEVDPYENRRVHAWIVVLPGKRDITEAFFIEPFTGRAFATNHDEFGNIEAIWNHRQYYVNMQELEPGEELIWDVHDSQKWEPVFAKNTLKQELDVPVDSQESMPTAEEQAAANKGNSGPGWPFKGFEMPRPWSEPIVVSKKRYLRFCKNGFRLARYYKCDMEMYQQYERKDGLLSKFILFKNRRKTKITTVKEVYENRRDRLRYRKHLVRDSILREYFAPGHVRGFRMHEVCITTGEQPAKFSELYRALNCFNVQENVVRTMTYYSEYRNDGLIKLVQLPDEVLWYYEGRKDNLVFRRIKYGTQIDRSYAVEALKCKGDQRPIALMVEKFDRNKEQVNPDLDIYLRELDITGNTLHLVYQPADGMIMSTQRRYHLPDFNEGPQSGVELPAGFLRMNDEVVSVIFRDQLKEEQRLPIDVWDEMAIHYRKSLDAILGVRRAEDDFKEEIAERIEEERQPALWHSPYDVERHPRAAMIVNKTQEADILKQPANEQNAVFDPTSFDWVAPYMAAYGDKEVQGLEDALAIRQTVLEDLRERLLYTANALEKAHEMEFAKLQSLNEKFRKAQIAGELSPKDFTIYENDKAGIQFKMHMLERRQELLQFEGPAKLKKLNDWILQDPRFSRWLQGMQLETRDHVIQDELMTVKKNTPHWTPAQRKKVWKLQSEDGDIVVEPMDKDEAGHARGDASTHRLLSPHTSRAAR